MKSAFVANADNPIILINPTAQVDLTHHLDDEISKEASVGINLRATQEPVPADGRKPALTDR